MPKSLTVDTCDECPHFDIDPNDVDAKFWGVPSCRHPDIGIRSLPNSDVRGVEWEIPQWCPLPDAMI